MYYQNACYFNVETGYLRYKTEIRPNCGRCNAKYKNVVVRAHLMRMEENVI